MSRPKLSELIPLDKKSNLTFSNQGLLNPINGRVLSTTPSPVSTPLKTQSISALGLPSLSPLPEPNLPLSTLNGGSGLPPIDIGNLVGDSSSPGLGGSSIQQSLANLKNMPPSPSTGVLPTTKKIKTETRTPSL